MLKTSEFWIAVATAIGSFLVDVFHVVPKETWDAIFWPAVVYVIGRLTSKAAKMIGGA